jgi:hypothetical protein
MNKPTLLSSLAVALFMFVSLSIQAQTVFGVRAGVNLSSIGYVDESDDKQDTEAIPTFQIGITVDMPVATDFYLQPALLYSGKGFKQDGGWLAGSDNEFKAKVSYVELPVNLLYKPQLGTGNLLLGAGPYLAYGTGGKWEAEGQLIVGDIVLSESEGDVIFKNDVKDGEFGNYLYGKPWDYGANVMLGYEFPQQFSVQLNAQFGIANLQPDIDGRQPNGHIRNNSYGISVGYRFR